MAEETTEQRLTRLERDFGGSMQQIAHSLSELESAQYDQGAVQSAHSRDLLDIKKRLGKIESTMATKQDLAELSTQMLDSFKQMLAILDERLPKKGE